MIVITTNFFPSERVIAQLQNHIGSFELYDDFLNDDSDEHIRTILEEKIAIDPIIALFFVGNEGAYPLHGRIEAIATSILGENPMYILFNAEYDEYRDEYVGAENNTFIEKIKE